MSRLSPTEYAKRRGCTLQAVLAAAKSGRITRGADGLIDPEQADIDWKNNTRKRGEWAKPRTVESNARSGKAAAATWAAKAKAAAPVIETQAHSDAPLERHNPTYSESRASKEFYEAEIKRLEMEVKKGVLVERKSVEESAFRTYRVYRDAMLNIPNRIASQLATETNAAVIHDLLLSEIRQTLDDFMEKRDAA